MKETTAQQFGSLGKSFGAPAAAAAVIGAALLASDTSDTSETAWSPAAACLLPDVLPVAGTLLSYGGSRQLAAGGTVTHSGALTVGGVVTATGGNPGFRVDASSVAKMLIGYSSGRRMLLASDCTIEFENGTAVTDTPNIKLLRASAGLFQVQADNGIAIKNLAGSADAALTCGAITASGQVTGSSFRVASGALETYSGSTRLQYQSSVFTFIDSGRLDIASGGVGQIRLGGTGASHAGIYNSGTTTRFRTADNSADGPISCGVITASGFVKLTDGTYTAGFIPFTSGGSDAILVRNSTNTGNANFEASKGTFATLRSVGAVTIEGAINANANSLTCGAITASGNLALRNGLTAMTAELFETYTSATNYGSLCLKATASGHQIGSARGTSGSNRAVQLGHFDASGVFTAGITVATTGLTTIYTPSDVAFGLTLDSASMGFFYMRPTWDGSGVWRFGPSTNAYRTRFNGMTEFRVESGASRTITEDQHITFEMTSDTAGNLVYRGSDGTTRRMGMDFDTTAVNYLPLSGGTLTGALSLGANALTCGAITASGNIVFAASPSSSGEIQRNGSSGSQGVVLRETSTGAAISVNPSTANIFATSGLKIYNDIGTAGGPLTCGAITASGLLKVRHPSLTVGNSGDAAEILLENGIGDTRFRFGFVGVNGSISSPISGITHLLFGRDTGNVTIPTGTLTCGAITASGLTTISSGQLALSTAFVSGPHISYNGSWMGVGNGSSEFAFVAGVGLSGGSGQSFMLGASALSYDIRYSRNATGPRASIRAAGGLEVKNLDDSADAPIACGAITASAIPSLGVPVLSAKSTVDTISATVEFYSHTNNPIFTLKQHPSTAASGILTNVSQINGLNTISVGSGSAFGSSSEAININSGNMMVGYDGSGTKGYVGTRLSAGLSLYTNNVERLSISSTGAITASGSIGFASNTAAISSVTSNGIQILSADTNWRSVISSSVGVNIGNVSGTNNLAINNAGIQLISSTITASGTVNYSDGTIDARTSMNHALTLRATGAANAIRVLDSGGATKWSVDSTGSMTIGTLGYITFPHSTRLGDPNFVVTGGGTGIGLATSGSFFLATGGTAATFIVGTTGSVTASGAIQETPTQSALDPTTTNIPAGKRMGWYNSTLAEFRDWVNIGGTLLKSAAYT